MDFIDLLPHRIKQQGAGLMIDLQYATGLYKELNIGSITAAFPNSEFNQVDSIRDIENSILPYALEQTNPSDIIYDVGADRGLYSTILGGKLEKGKMISFEPHPVTSIKLRKIVEFNAIPSLVIPFALGSHQHRATIDGYQIVDSPDGRIKVRRGDTIVDEYELPVPDFMKVDTEGMELDVLKGFEGIFESSPPSRILCEIHPESSIQFGMKKTDIATLYDWLNNRGYSLKELGKAKGQTYLWAEL